MRYDQQQQQSDDRPKLFMPPVAHMNMHVPPQHDYNHLMQQHAQHAQQHQQHAIKYEPGDHYYQHHQHHQHHPAPPPPVAAAQHAPMLHVSSSAYHPQPTPPSAGSSPAAKKRSREDLNLKEKQRMFKLNERIAQLKTLLDDAGVQTKKSKQSILDNTTHFIEKLQSDLLIANQKAERAERQADSFRAQGSRAGSAKADKLLRSCFERTSTPRVVVDVGFKTVAFNAAFAKFVGVSEPALKKKKTLRPYLCADKEVLDGIFEKTRDSKQSRGVLVKTTAAGGKSVSVSLVAAAVTDDSGEVVHIEFSLIPVDTLQLQQPTTAKRQTTGEPQADDKKKSKKGPAGFELQL